MLRTLTAFAATCLLATAALAVPSFSSAPKIEAEDALTGNTFKLSSQLGKVVVLEWNNFGCPFVQKHYNSGNMQALQKAAIADGVVWVTINSSAEGKQGYLRNGAEVKDALAAHDHAAPSHYLLDHDGKIGRAYDAKTTPHMFVIDGMGKIIYQGAIDDMPTPTVSDIAKAKNYITQTLARLKKNEKITEHTTRAYGCSIKYGF